MARKSLGFVQTFWTCPSCGTRNPGTARTCQQCGNPQPDNVAFEQASHEEIITDEAMIEKAKAGADVHCYYCGTRNPATATNCSQCGADLTQAVKRVAGEVMGAHRDKEAPDVACPSCGFMNDPDSNFCINCGSSLPKFQPQPEASVSNIQAGGTSEPQAEPKEKKGCLASLFQIAMVFLLLTACTSLCAVTDITGQVESVQWERTIEIEGLVPVTEEAWRDQVPSGADMGSCVSRVRGTQPDPAPGAREICGTPYTIDRGNGFAEVVQDCEYEVMDDWCQYDVTEWQPVDMEVARGTDFNPRWPNVNLSRDEREGSRSEDYGCTFATNDGRYTYWTSNEREFRACEIGSTWTLFVNSFGGVNRIEPGLVE